MAFVRQAFSALNSAFSSRSRSVACATAAFWLSGCATSGALNFKCDGFLSYVDPVPPSRIVREIQSDSVTRISIGQDASLGALPSPSQPSASSAGPVAPSLFSAVRNVALSAAARGRTPGLLPSEEPAILLLSGGGQWGAFGAGFLDTLRREGKMPADFRVITGISTGGMQSLFLASYPNYSDAYSSLITNYSPGDERQLVDRHSAKWMAGITGALAGLKPLRRTVETALCERGDPAAGCPMIDGIAKSGRSAFIGFVRADTGQLQYARASDIARLGTREATAEQRRNAQQCLTAVALASAAMPVFFQQVRINGVTYYDGGVRQSVFEADAAATIDEAVRAAKADAFRLNLKAAEVEAPPLYVMRNGPTQLLGPDAKPNSVDPDVDANADALTNAFRSEAIVVNQLEVGSIAALRLTHPTGTIKLVTADGFTGFQWKDPTGVSYTGCPKPKDVMFDPRFMLCLQSFGQSKAERSEPWITISPLDLSPAPVPASAAAKRPGR